MFKSDTDKFPLMQDPPKTPLSMKQRSPIKGIPSSLILIYKEQGSHLLKPILKTLAVLNINLATVRFTMNKVQYLSTHLVTISHPIK